MTRPGIDQTMMDVARVLARRATCPKLSVGCVLIDVQKRIIGTGYNGTARYLPHCTEQNCAGACAPAGSDLCEAIHAEQNALLACADTDKIWTAYVTHVPCMRCIKTLLNTSCTRIVVGTLDKQQLQAVALWSRYGKSLELV